MSEAWLTWVAVARRLALALVLFSILPAAFLTCYVAVFGAPLSAVMSHLWVLGSVCAAVAGLRLGLSLVPIGERAHRAAAAAVLAGTSLAMFLFYGLVLIGLQSWGRVTSVELISTYVPQAGEVLQALGYAPWLVAATPALLLISFFAAAYVYLKRHDWIVPLRRIVRRGVASLLCLLFFTLVVAFGNDFPYRDWGAQGEPLSLSLYPARGETAMQSHGIGHSRSAALDQAEEAVRAAYRPNHSARASNVILIVVDALRADHLSTFGYARQTSPNLETWARDGTLRLKTSAVSVCNESVCGLRALVSSRYVDAQANRPITLSEVLKKHGYQVHLILSGDHANFYGLRAAYGPSDSYFDGASQRARYMNDDRLILDQLDNVRPWDGRPVMFQFHLMSAHSVGKRFDTTPEFGPSANYDRLRLAGHDAEARQRAINFYDRGVLQVDRMVKDILGRLQAGGYLRDALVVLTGDHGESLGERGRYSHAHSVWEESLRTPFVLLAFGSADPGRLVEPRVSSQIDIAPTVLRALGMPLPASWQGWPLQTPTPERFVYFQQSQFIGLVDARNEGKLYKHWRDVRKGEQFTFDLLADPGETEDVTLQVPEPVRHEWQRLLFVRSAAIAPDAEVRRERLLEAAGAR